MSNPRSTHRGDSQEQPTSPSRHDAAAAGKEAQSTYASFSPATLSATTPSATSAAKRRSTILVHQKSPLLLATPPQITRALAYSHPFLLPLNRLVGLLTWTTNDPWESFLLLAAFWAAVLYGDFVVRVAGPLVLVLVLIGGMYGRRFSPLSSSGWSEPGLGTGDGNAVATDAKNAKAARRTKNLSVDGATEKNGKPGKAGNGNEGAGGARGHTRNQSSLSEVTNTRHQKTLDEIVETLREFTARCNILLEPLLELTDFLSTQRTPTSATTRPALTTLFVRILLCIPFWILLTLPPLRIITTRRVILILGTIFLSWHSRVIRVTRVILWRSATIRRVLGLVTGLTFETPTRRGTGVVAAGDAGAVGKAKSPTTPGNAKQVPRESELTKALRRARGRGTGVRFTFIIYENQRRWIGLGWTSSLFGYERPAWADEHNNAVPPRAEFELPEVEDGSNMRWQWAEGSRWRVDGVSDDAVMPGDGKETEWDYDAPGGKMGWVYYDNKWQNGRRGQDGWNRWTRRRKWYRDAELVEADDLTDETHSQPAEGHHTEQQQQQQQQQQQPKNPRPSSAPTRGARGLSPAPAVPTVDLTPSTPDLPLTPSSPPSTHYHHSPSTSTSQQDDRDEDTTHADSASILSTSSRSARFSLRRRITDSSHRSIGGGTSGSGTTTTTTTGQRSRRASVAASNASEDDAASLGPQTRMAVQEAGGEAGSWGVGDEIRMGLE